MARKTAKVALEDLTAKVGGKLPPILAGCPSWAPHGHGCSLGCVQEILAPGHRRATLKDKETFLAAEARERAEQAAEAARQRAEQPAPRPAEPAASARPAPRAEQEPGIADHGGYLDPEAQRREAQLRAAYWRDTRPDTEERQRFASG